MRAVTAEAIDGFSVTGTMYVTSLLAARWGTPELRRRWNGSRRGQYLLFFVSENLGKLL